MIVLLLSLIACSDCDSPAIDCNYLLQDPNADGMQCVSTRPYFSFGPTVMDSDEFVTVDLVLEAAPEGDVSIPEVSIDVKIADDDMSNELVGGISVEYSDGTTRSRGIKSYSNGNLSIFFPTVDDIAAGSSETYILTLDYSWTDIAPGTSIFLGFSNEQSWSSEEDAEQTSVFPQTDWIGFTFP